MVILGTLSAECVLAEEGPCDRNPSELDRQRTNPMTLEPNRQRNLG
jgi:hypothetical protein